MRKSFLLLISPLLLTGCLHLPGLPGGGEDVARTKTVQKGTPEEIDPNVHSSKGQLKPMQTGGLAGGVLHTTEYPLISDENGNTPFSKNQIPITPDQVNENNAHSAIEQLRNEMTKDCANCNAPGAWPR